MRPPAELSTRQVEQLKSDNIREFEAIYHQYKQTVYALCLRNTRNTADAEDLTQEVFLQVHRGIKGLRDYEALKSGLYKVTRNAILMHFRKRRVLVMSLHYVLDPKTLAVLDIAEMIVTP